MSDPELMCDECEQPKAAWKFPRRRNGARSPVCAICLAARRRAAGHRSSPPSSHHNDYYECNPYASSLGTWGSIPD